MTQEVRDRLFGFQQALDHPITLGVSLAIPVLIVASGAALLMLKKSGLLPEDKFADAFGRWKSWSWIGVCILAPVLLGAAWTVLAVTLLSIGCYREFARATGISGQRWISAAVLLGILVVNFAAIDHFDRLFFAMAPLTVGLIAIVTIPLDRPQGYVQRVALGSLGFLLFGFSLSYVSNISNAPNYRPILILMLLGVAMNDIFAYCTGSLLGGRKLIPVTSPGKTVSGAVGALVLTTLLVALLAHYVFQGTEVDRWPWLLFLGVLISALGQLGDLILSSIKRDAGIKDIGTAIPGHGGLLDRFDSLVLAPPAVYHFLSLILGPLGGEEPIRIFTGG